MKIEDNKVIFDSDDIFNLDITLNGVIKSALVTFKESKRYGIPGDLLDNPHEYSDDEMKEATARWEEILDDMIYAFSIDDPYDAYDDQDKSPYDYSQSWCDENKQFKPALKEGFTKEDADRFEEKRDDVIKGMKARIKRGRELFIKYYDNLWV